MTGDELLDWWNASVQGREDHGATVSYTATEIPVGKPFVSIDGRDFTVGKFVTMVGTFGGWRMRIEFVPDHELHERPNLKVRDPGPKIPPPVAQGGRAGSKG